MAFRLVIGVHLIGCWHIRGVMCFEILDDLTHRQGNGGVCSYQ